MKRFELGPLVIRTGGDETYPKSEVLSEGENFKIIKRESEENIEDSCYVYSLNDEDVVFIKGSREGNEFHIMRIENTTKDGVSGKFLPSVFSVMEDDLRKQGIKRLTTQSLTRLAPILMKRYGFTSNQTANDVRHLAEKNKYGKAVGLVKEL